MPKRWMWKQLADASGEQPYMAYRKPEYMYNRFGQIVKCHSDYPRTDAVQRFIRLTERVLIGDDYCIVWRGGDTFRVDDDTVTTPARFFWRAIHGERLQDNQILRRTCQTPHCVKHREIQ